MVMMSMRLVRMVRKVRVGMVHVQRMVGMKQGQRVMLGWLIGGGRRCCSCSGCRRMLKQLRIQPRR